MGQNSRSASTSSGPQATHPVEAATPRSSRSQRLGEPALDGGGHGRQTPRPPAERGQSAVEFSLLFPLLVFLLLFVIEISVALYTSITVTGAAREAVRYAAVSNLVGASCEAGTVRGRAVSSSSDIVECSEVSVWFVDLDADTLAQRGDAVVVKITHNYELFTPLGALASAFSFGAIPDSFNIGACADARLDAPTQEPDPTTFPGFQAGDCGS